MNAIIIISLVVVYAVGCILAELRQIAIENVMTLGQYRRHIKRKEFPRWVLVSMSWVGLAIINICADVANIKTKHRFEINRKNTMSKQY